MRCIFRFTIVSLLLLTSILPAVVSAQHAWFEPAEIDEGDTTILIVELQGDGFNMTLEGLDTLELEKNFEILNTSKKVMTQMNGSSVITKNRWEIELLPLKTGELIVPPMKLKDQLTPKLVLSVKPQQSGHNQIVDQPVHIEISAKPENPYIGQQTNITIKLYHKVRIANGTLSEPQATNADIYRIGNDISYSQSIKDQRYEVLERTFALFPNSSGPLEILPVAFRGQIDDPSKQSNSTYGSFLRQVKRIKRFSNSLRIGVRDIPASFSGKYWLPANDLRASDQWSDQGNELKVGDSSIREIKIIADGLPAESLPEQIMDTNLKGMNVYPDKVARNNQDIGKKLVGRVEQKYAMIVSSAGYFDIPKLTLKWWDVDEDIEKVIELAPRTLIVTGESGLGNQNQSFTGEEQTQIHNTQRIQASKLQTNYWQWIALALCGLWLLTLLLWYRARPRRIIKPQQASGIVWDMKGLEQACHSNDPVLVRNQLIAWARVNWPDDKLTGLHDLMDKVENEVLKQELNSLDQMLFSGKNNQWSGVNLLNACKQEQTFKRKFKTNQKVEEMPSLYAS